MATGGFRILLRFAPLVRLAGGAQVIRQVIHRQLIAASGETEWITEAVVRGYTADAAANVTGTFKAYGAMSRAREPEPLASHLAEIRAPVVLLVGAAPHSSGPSLEEIALLGRSLPALSVDSVAGAGHYLHEEQPAAVLAGLQRLRLRVAEAQAGVARP